MSNLLLAVDNLSRVFDLDTQPRKTISSETETPQETHALDDYIRAFLESAVSLFLHYTYTNYIHQYTMDPGQELLQHLKTVPNLVSEEPSTITPSNTSFVDVPWSDFSKMLASKSESTAQKLKENATPTAEDDHSPIKKDEGSVEDFTLGNWDAATGYQDKQHDKEICKHVEH